MLSMCSGYLVTKSSRDSSCCVCSSAGNNSLSSDIVRPNFENVRPISHYDRTRWPNISPAHLELSSSRCCQSINYVRSNLSNVRPKWRFERTYVPWIKKNYFQHWCSLNNSRITVKECHSGTQSSQVTVSTHNIIMGHAAWRVLSKVVNGGRMDQREFWSMAEVSFSVLVCPVNAKREETSVTREE